jgi:hypothetical protein
LHSCWHEADCPAHASLHVDVVGTHDDQKGAVTHDPEVHCIGALHNAQASPLVPHASCADPGMQVFPWQHPVGHDTASHVHVPPTQCCPVPQLPLLHIPPQPSLAPHALQLGVQPHVPPVQVVPPAHAVHTVPPCPHAPSSVPGSQVVPLQQPLHEVTSHWHAPATHRCPLAQLPCAQVPAHPSLAPHAFPLQSGVHGPLPHTLGVPPPPHV